MSIVGQIERKTQDRVVELFRDRLGYEYLGNWEYREGNSHVEEQLLENNLLARGVDANLTNKAIAKQLGLSPATVKTHAALAISAVGATNRTEAAIRARAAGLI